MRGRTATNPLDFFSKATEEAETSTREASKNQATNSDRGVTVRLLRGTEVFRGRCSVRTGDAKLEQTQPISDAKLENTVTVL